MDAGNTYSLEGDGCRCVHAKEGDGASDTLMCIHPCDRTVIPQ